MLYAEPKEHKHFRPGTRPEGSVTGGHREIVYVPNVCVPFLAPIHRQRSREKLYTPPPPSPISGQKAFSRGGGWVYILRPHAAGILYAPPFYTPPTPRRVYSGVGGWGCIKIGLVRGVDLSGGADTSGEVQGLLGKSGKFRGNIWIGLLNFGILWPCYRGRLGPSGPEWPKESEMSSRDLSARGAKKRPKQQRAKIDCFFIRRS